MKCSSFATCCLTVVLLGGLASAAAQTLLGTEFTYQGQLNESGVLADGDYDFVFRLYDADTGGAQIGSDFPVDDWPVTDGLFTVQVDFGDSAFDSEARWLEVAVRPWDSNDPHAVLSPRHPVTAAPVALYALDGPGATGLWEAVGNNIVNTNTGFVGINRADTVTGAEYFGIQTPTGDGQYGGMYIRTDSTTGKPFYGYNTGAETAWTYLDGSTGTWYVYNDGARITVEDTGNVGIGTPDPQSALHVATTGPVLTLQDTDSSGDAQAGYVSLRDYVGSERGWFGYGSAFNGDLTVANSAGDVVLDSNGQRVTLKPDGNVGIGTASPSTALEVNGTVTATAFVGDGSGLTGLPSGLWETSGSDIYYSAGNVGIGGGTFDPDFRLDVNGDIQAGSSSGGIDAYTSTSLVLPSYAAVYGSAYNMDSYGYLGGAYGVYGQTDSASSNAAGVRGNVSSTSPGMYSAGVQGHNSGTGNFGYGVHGTQDGSGVGVYGSTPSGYGVYGTSNTGIGVSGSTYSVASNAIGVEGFVNSTAPGSYSAGVRGRNNGTGGLGIGVWGSQDGSGWGVYGETPSGRGVYGQSTDGTGVEGYSTNGVGVFGGSFSGYAGYFIGTVRVSVLEVAGADVAEKFPTSEEIEPGTVVEIDPDIPGELRMARGAYNRRVAGVVSGAGDIPAGTILGNLPGSEDAPPIALSGRVWVKCDANETPVELGDLLTTSDTPGHAMAVSDFSRAHGTVIGKAMTGLEEGTGLVLVLVNLQ